MRAALQVAPRQVQRTRFGFVDIQCGDLGAPRQHFGGEIAEAGTQIGAMAGQGGWQMLDQQRRRRVDAVPGEHARAADEAPVQDLARRIQCRPARLQGRIGTARQRAAPVRAAVMLGEAAGQAGELAQIGLARARTLVVGLAGHHAAAAGGQRHRTRKQGAGLFALAGRQHQHHRIAGGVGLDLGFLAHLPAAALQRLGERAEALFAGQRLGHGMLAQRPAIARAQEQHRALWPGQHPLRERQEQGSKRSIVRASHRIIGSGTGPHCKGPVRAACRARCGAYTGY